MGDDPLGSLAPLALALLAADAEPGTYAQLKQQLRDFTTGDPIDALAVTVIGGGLAFYAAERDTNPGIATPWDAILYMATSLSVGYDNMFPTTPTGHMLATLVHTFGPALASRALDPPATDTPAPQADEAAILARLDRIVELLERGQPSPG